MPGRNDCTVILSERSESKNLLAQQKTASHGKKKWKRRLRQVQQNKISVRTSAIFRTYLRTE